MSVLQHHRAFFAMGLDTTMGWPSIEQKVTFKGHDITVRPETDEQAPSLVVRLGPDLDQQAAGQMLYEFMSGLAWTKKGGLTETFSTCMTGSPLAIGKGTGRCIDDAPIGPVPLPTDDKAKLALAIYREASSVNLIPYQFLGFFKVINIIKKTGADQMAWITSTLQQITERDAVARRTEIQASHADVAQYLYESGRCAVAHAYQDPLVNPDDPTDLQRLHKDLPLIKALAEHAIEYELGV